MNLAPHSNEVAEGYLLYLIETKQFGKYREVFRQVQRFLTQEQESEFMSLAKRMYSLSPRHEQN